ncbi:OmpL47-type beta-barrel domain-containing protein, partial [Neobacillus niacini]|uniref:OmpL47-type beta-barrel domain-containing protein n=1 Tax=Neobacillus niacini TaxID=86668 RepID=UPI003B587640
TSNVSEQWYQGETKVELTATDDLSGVAKTFYSVNGSEFVEGTSFTVSETGVKEVSFYSVDKAGNVEETKTVKVKIDKNAPETTSNVSEQWYQGETKVELTSTDDLSGVAKTFYSVNGSELKEGTSFVVSKEGVNTVTFYSVDNVGNVETAKTVEVKVDKTAPTVSIPLESEQALGSTFTLDYVAADNLSGIEAETVTLNGQVYKKGDKIILDKPGSYKLLVTVTDAAGWTTQVEKEFLVYIQVTLEVLPKVIKGNNGVFTVKATLPKGLESISFDVSTVTLNGVSADPKNNGLQKQAEKGHFKFEREDFTWKKGEVALELRGKLENGYLFIGKTTVEVK